MSLFKKRVNKKPKPRLPPELKEAGFELIDVKELESRYKSANELRERTEVSLEGEYARDRPEDVPDADLEEVE